MMSKQIMTDGTIPSGFGTLTVDNVIQTFTVTIRSNQTLTAGMIKDLLERRYEVVEISQQDKLTVCR